MAVLVTAQVLLLGAILIGAALLKLPPLFNRGAADRTALATALPGRLVWPAWLTIGAVELIVGAWLLTPWHPFAAALATAGCTGLGLVYLSLAKLRAPAKPCGCMGSLSRGAVGWSGIFRSSCLVALAVWLVVGSSVRASGAVPLSAVILATAELAAFIWFDPELRVAVESAAVRASVRVRTARARYLLRSPNVLTGDLQETESWSQLRSLTSPQVPRLSETWSDGPNIFLSYSLTHQGRDVTAVFYMRARLLRSRVVRHATRGAVVDDDRILHRLGVPQNRAGGGMASG
jgi:hypothetical protein